MENKKKKVSIKREAWHILCIVFAAAMYGFSINNFLHGSGLLSGGFTGISLLGQHALKQFAGIDVPLSAIYIPLNAVPAILAFKFI